MQGFFIKAELFLVYEVICRVRIQKYVNVLSWNMYTNCAKNNVTPVLFLLLLEVGFTLKDGATLLDNK